MENGYKILWTNHALSELKHTYEHIEKFWTAKELKRLAVEIERTLKLISTNPELFPIDINLNCRRAVILKLNTIYYRKKNNYVEILSFYANRQNPDNRKV